MEIVIESDPYRPASASPAYLRSPSQQQPPPLVNSSSAFYYATLPRGGSGIRLSADVPDGAPTTTSVRRVDKSGLLEIADVEPTARQTASRLLAGTDLGTLSRRLERSGLLEAVPEVPDQCHRSGLASEELLAAAATARSMVERQQHLLGAETDLVESSVLRRRSFVPVESQDSTSTNASNETEISTRSAPRVKFAMDESNASAVPPAADELAEPQRRAAVTDCLGRLTLSNIPDVIEAHGTASTATTTADGTATTAVNSADKVPEGERAEAEGCEHTAIEALEETRVAYKGASTAATKIGHGDNIQAVHVIILSEQL